MTDKKGTILQTLKRLGWIYCHICGVLLILGIIFLWAVLNGWGGFVRPICPLGQGAYDEIKGVCRPECQFVDKGVCVPFYVRCSLLTHPYCDKKTSEIAPYQAVYLQKGDVPFLKALKKMDRTLQRKNKIILLNVSPNRVEADFSPILVVQKQGDVYQGVEMLSPVLTDNRFDFKTKPLSAKLWCTDSLSLKVSHFCFMGENDK